VWHLLGDAHGDRCLTAAEVEHDHVRSQVREKEVCVDSCAASRKRRLDLPSFANLVQTKALRGQSKFGSYIGFLYQRPASMILPLYVVVLRSFRVLPARE